MNTEIQIFNFESEENQIRILGTADDPRFCLADICKVLGLTAKGVGQRLEDEVISTYPITDRLGRIQQMKFVNEDGFYDVVLESRKSIARKFRKWVTHEVLPSIRKTGAYVQPEKIEEPTDGYVPKFFSGMKVFTLRDASKLLKVRYEYLRQLLSKPERANLKEGRDYLKLVGGLLKGFIHENPSVPSNLPSLILLFESGFNKICDYFKMKVSSIFSSDSGEITLNFGESTNDEVEAKIEKITEQAIAQKVLARLYELFKNSEKEERAIRETISALTAISLTTTWIPKPSK